MNKCKVYYQLLNYSFKDSNNDGIGDFKGIIEKIDYLKNLGIEGILLSPIHKATSYHGYDILDYYSINELYGDFNELIETCNENNISLMMDLVLNHTSINHEWFQSAVKYHLGLSDDSKYKDYYIFSLSEKNEPGWHYYIIDNKKIWYYGSFAPSMPDLNYSFNCKFESDPIFSYMVNVCKHYIDMGIKGFRLDAAMHIYEKEVGVGDSKKNSQFFKAFCNAIHSYNKDILIVGEVTIFDDTINNYNNIDSLFNFPITSNIENIKDTLNKARIMKNNQSFQCANMISNHDYDVGRITNKITNEKELYLHAILNILLPGIPFIYYGDEIGLIAKMKYKYEEYCPSYYDVVNRTMMPWEETFINSKFIVKDVILDGKNIIESCCTIGTIYNKNINSQLKDNDNLYNLYKKLIQLRNKHKEIFYFGNIDVIENNYFTIKYKKEKLKVSLCDNGDINTKYFSIKVDKI